MNSNTGTKKTDTNKKNANNIAEDKKDKFFERTTGKSNGVKAKLSEKSAGAQRKLYTKSNSAQLHLENKNKKTNDSADKKIGAVKEFGQRAAGVLESSSNYVKNFDFVQTGNRFKKTVSEKPHIGIALAGVFGLLIGLLVGRKTS